MPSNRSLRAQIGILLRFLRDYPTFLKTPLAPDQCQHRVGTKLASREASFLNIIERAVFRQPHSPYLQLMKWAAIEPHQIKKWVDQLGIEGTLETMYDAGVYLTLDEFKGRKPIVRQGLKLSTCKGDFDNPLSIPHFVSQTGGSRSAGDRIRLDLAHYTQDAVYDYFFLKAHDLIDRPYALWRPTPPWGAGIKALLSRAKLGLVVDKWFVQNSWKPTSRNWKHSLMTAFAVYGGRLMGHELAVPEQVRLRDAWRVARWLADQKRQGRAAWLNTNAASGVRVCMAALEKNIDISETLFRFGGEPLTPAKANVVVDAGARAVCHYTMGEIGRIGIACGDPESIDEVHILSDKIALIQRERTLAENQNVMANIYTTLLPTCPRFMLNVESGDCGILKRRQCGCLMGELGYDLHLHTIRGYEKLTSEGMNFLGSDLIRLVEEILPKHFGGYPTDYQFLETEEDGLPKVNLVVSPRVGHIEEDVIVAVALDGLNAVIDGSDDYAGRWREGNTLRVLRQEPLSTGASKVLALHVQKPH